MESGSAYAPDMMAGSQELVDRRAISRLIHRFGFGPRPGEFEELLGLGFEGASARLLSGPNTYVSNQAQLLGLSDLGAQPRPNTPEIVEYVGAKRFQLRTMTLWWLDQMVTIENPIMERMTWFWHGHWATSYAKVDEPLVMFNHVHKLRKHSLGDFKELSREMVIDGALIFWLDGQKNTSIAPNENLSRELMELFTLGVNRYSEEDVKQTAKALTGYQVKKSSGAITRNARRSFTGSIAFLGTTGIYDAQSLSDYLVARPDCQKFIAERLWFRFIDSTEALPANSEIQSAFADRAILPAVSASIKNPAIFDARHSQVKSPIDWLISSLRAIGVIPSKFERPDYLINLLNSLGQRPFFPPNVGGWPADEAWLSAASAQTRISASQYLMKSANLSPIADVKQVQRVDALADWLGIASWSDRTRQALNGAVRDPQRLAVLGICSPEYLVNA